jgi:hypothetical protein
MGVPKLRPSAASAHVLTARHASDADDEIQLTTKLWSHHSVLRG